MKHCNYQVKLSTFLLISAFLLLAPSANAEIRIEWPEEYGYPDMVDWNQAYLDLFTGYSNGIVINADYRLSGLFPVSSRTGTEIRTVKIVCIK